MFRVPSTCVCTALQLAPKVFWWCYFHRAYLGTLFVSVGNTVDPMEGMRRGVAAAAAATPRLASDGGGGDGGASTRLPPKIESRVDGGEPVDGGGAVGMPDPNGGGAVGAPLGAGGVAGGA